MGFESTVDRAGDWARATMEPLMAANKMKT
jgi:hypothetical protein